MNVLTPEQFGAVPGKDCTAAFVKMMQQVDKSTKTDAGGGVPVATCVISLGAGPYLVKQPWMVKTAGRAQGLSICGMSKRASEIVWQGTGPMLVNWDRWMGVTWENVSFRGDPPAEADPGAFLYSYSTGANQDWNFVRCEWRGRWDYGIGLDGPKASNTNSEWVFDRCTVTGAYENAWLYSGMTPEFPQQDQFLNFTLRDCKIEHQYGDALRFDRGGSITASGGSWIITGQRPDGRDSRFFLLGAGPHADSVQNLLVEGVRFEVRNTTTQVISSAWNGQVSFIGCMDDAHGYKSWAADAVTCSFVNPGGVLFQGCSLMGRHKYTTTKVPSRQRAVYLSCARKNNRTAATFLRTEGAYASKLSFTHIADRDAIG